MTTNYQTNSKPPFKKGDRLQQTADYKDKTIFKVLGEPVFQEQWWIPVEDPREEDPTFIKAGAVKIYKEEIFEYQWTYKLKASDKTQITDSFYTDKIEFYQKNPAMDGILEYLTVVEPSKHLREVI